MTPHILNGMGQCQWGILIGELWWTCCCLKIWPKQALLFTSEVPAVLKCCLRRQLTRYLNRVAISEDSSISVLMTDCHGLVITAW